MGGAVTSCFTSSAVSCFTRSHPKTACHLERKLGEASKPLPQPPGGSVSNAADEAAPTLLAQVPKHNELCRAMAEESQNHGMREAGVTELNLAATEAMEEAGRARSSSLEEVLSVCKDQFQGAQGPSTGLDCVLDDRLAKENAGHSHSLHLCVADFRELQLEMATMGKILEEREQDILNIQFEMVELQSRFHDQAGQGSKTANAVQTDSEEPVGSGGQAEAVELPPSQRDELSNRLLRKVAELSQELERSRAAYKALERTHRSVVAKHESEQRSLVAELSGYKRGLRQPLCRSEGRAPI